MSPRIVSMILMFAPQVQGSSPRIVFNWFRVRSISPQVVALNQRFASLIHGFGEPYATACVSAGLLSLALGYTLTLVALTRFAFVVFAALESFVMCVGGQGCRRPCTIMFPLSHFEVSGCYA